MSENEITVYRVGKAHNYFELQEEDHDGNLVRNTRHRLIPMNGIARDNYLAQLRSRINDETKQIKEVKGLTSLILNFTLQVYDETLSPPGWKLMAPNEIQMLDGDLITKLAEIATERNGLKKEKEDSKKS